MTQTHKIRPSADRLVEWSDEEMQRMRAAVAACDGFIESRWPYEPPRCEETHTQPMRRTVRGYYDNVTAQQDEPTPDTASVKQQGILCEYDAVIREMCADPDMSCAAIGKHLGVSHTSVARYTRQHGIERAWERKRADTRAALDARRQKIRQWLREGRQQTWIAEQLGVKTPRLSTYIKKHKLYM